MFIRVKQWFGNYLILSATLNPSFRKCTLTLCTLTLTK